jgi:hypothetical protein
MVYKCDEASATTGGAVLPDEGVSRKSRRFESGSEFRFLNASNLYRVVNQKVIEFSTWIRDSIHVQLEKIKVRVRGKGWAGVSMNASGQKKDKDERLRTRLKSTWERKGR